MAGLRLYTYSQLEYITAAMLARHVKPGGARVLQVRRMAASLAVQRQTGGGPTCRAFLLTPLTFLVQVGGTTRDVFYYPASTVQVTIGGSSLNPGALALRSAVAGAALPAWRTAGTSLSRCCRAAGLWEQAGMQAKVPVSAVKAEPQVTPALLHACFSRLHGWLVASLHFFDPQPTSNSHLHARSSLLPLRFASPQKFLSTQAGAAADSIVLINTLQLWPDMQQLLAQVGAASMHGSPGVAGSKRSMTRWCCCSYPIDPSELAAEVVGTRSQASCSSAMHRCTDASHCLVPVQVYRVLKPGGTFVFIQRLQGGALQGLLGGGSALGACCQSTDMLPLDPAAALQPRTVGRLRCRPWC